MVRIMVQLTEEQVKVLKALAKARKTPVAKLVRESVAQYVIAARKEPMMEEKRRRALEFIKKIESGDIQFHDAEEKTDIARNHDKYLNEWKDRSW